MEILKLMKDDRMIPKAYFTKLALIACCAVTYAVPSKAVALDGEIGDRNDKICQEEKGPNYVYEAVLDTCVSCTSCGCEYNDPHCQKCIGYGILDCALGTTDPPKLDLTSQMPTQAAEVPTQTPQVPTDPMTPVSPEGNKGKLIGLAIAFCGVSLILASVLGLLMYKKWKKRRKNNLPHGQQDTEAAPESHPMEPQNHVP